MSEKCPISADEADPRTDPREILDRIKRIKILALLESGCSRRMAAQYVGCAASTITRTAQRDPHFAEQLAEAENAADVQVLRTFNRMMQQEKHWRVAAWMLERRNPDEYGRRAPHTFTGEQVMNLLMRGMQEALDVIPEENQDEFLDAFHDVLCDVAVQANMPEPHKLDLVIPTAAPVSAPPAEMAVERKVEKKADQKVESPRPNPASPAPRVNGSHANGHPKKPLANPQPVAAAMDSNRGNDRATTASEIPVNPPRRVSCLEQFVIRSPKPQLQEASS